MNEMQYNETKWEEYKLLVLDSLQKLDKKTTDIEDKLDDLKTRITILETKALVIGGLAGFGVTVVMEIIIKLLKIG